MPPLDDLGANILGNIPCLLKDEIKSMFLINLKDASDDQINKSMKSLKAKTAVCLLWIGTD